MLEGSAGSLPASRSSTVPEAETRAPQTMETHLQCGGGADADGDAPCRGARSAPLEGAEGRRPRCDAECDAGGARLVGGARHHPGRRRHARSRCVPRGGRPTCGVPPPSVATPPRSGSRIRREQARHAPRKRAARDTQGPLGRGHRTGGRGTRKARLGRESRCVRSGHDACGVASPLRQHAAERQVDVLTESERIPASTIYNRSRLTRENLRAFVCRTRAGAVPNNRAPPVSMP